MIDEPSKKSIDLTKLPREPWFRSAHLFGEGVQWVTADSAHWIEASYPRRDRLRAIWQFLSWHLSDGVPGRLDILERVWYFPWTESEAESEMAFAYAIAGLHRASIDHARRALELVVVGAYFVADHVDERSGQEWLASREETPLFSRALKALVKAGFAKEVAEHTAWRNELQDHYWALSDSVHVRGTKFGLRTMQSSNAVISGFPMIGFSPERLGLSLDLLIRTGELTLATLAITNPVLLFGVPISEKYGLNGPIGFYEKGIAEELRELLPDSLRDSFIELAAKDEGVISLREHFDRQPDITEDEVQAQIRDI